MDRLIGSLKNRFGRFGWSRKRGRKQFKQRSLQMQPLEKRELLSVTPEITLFDSYYVEVYDGSSLLSFGDTPVGSPTQQIFTIENWGTGDLSVDFGLTAVGTTVDQTFTVKNVGTGDLTLDTLSVPAGFTVVTPFDASVLPGGSTNFVIRLDAAAVGVYSGVLSFSTNDADEDPFDFTIAGEAVTPEPEIEVLDASPVAIDDGTGSFDFGSTTVATPVEQTFTINNTGTADLVLSSLSLPAGFTVLSSFASPVAAGGSTSLRVQLDATAIGSCSGTLSFVTNDADENPYDFTISGEVTSVPTPEISVVDESSTPIADGTGSIDFGNTMLGTAIEQTFTITNTGTADLTLGSLTIPTGFGVVSNFTSPVAPGGSTTLTVQLEADESGNYGGLLSFTTNDSDENPYDFTISGEVIEPDPEIVVMNSAWEEIDDQTGAVDVGTTPVGTPLTFNFWINNTGEGSLTLDRDSLALPDGFSAYSRFARTVAPESKTLLIVQLDAIQSGTFSGELSFASNDPDENPYNFTISGTVLPATGPVTLNDFGLFSDTGTADDDLITANPMLTGTVDGDFDGGYVQVEFDHDQDHQSTDGFVEVLNTAGSFVYDPSENDTSLAGYVGAVSIFHRLVEYDSAGNVLATGNWSQFDYTLESPPVGLPISSFQLLDDTGDWDSDGITSNPAVTASCDVGIGEYYSAAAIQFDVDGVLNGQAAVDEDGNVTYLPTGLDYGTA